MKRLAAAAMLLSLLIAILPAAAQDAPTLTLTLLYELAFENIVTREIVLSPDGGALALATTEDYRAYTLLLIDSATPENRHAIPFDAYIDDLAFGPAGTRIAVATADGIYIVDVIAGAVTHDFAFNDPSRLTNVAFAPDGDSVVFSASDGDTAGKVFWWNFITGEARTLLERDPRGYVVYAPVDLALSPDGTTAIASTRFTTYVLDVSGEAPPQTYGNFHVAGGLLFSPDGSRLAIGSPVSARLMLVDSARWEVVTSSGQFLGFGSMAFSQDSRRLALALYHPELQRTAPYILDAATGDILLVLDHPGAQSAAFSPDGAWLATSDTVGLLRLWDAASGVRLADAPMNASATSVLAFSPDGAPLFTLNDHALRAWGVANE